jgi:hypothetical protein
VRAALFHRRLYAAGKRGRIGKKGTSTIATAPGCVSRIYLIVKLASKAI